MELRNSNRDRGIVNPGTTCWLASCVHVLNSIPHFRRALNCIDTDQEVLRTDKNTFIAELQLALFKLRNSRDTSIQIDKLFAAGHALYPEYFVPNEHADCAECFYKILRTFEDMKKDEITSIHPLMSFFISTSETLDEQKVYYAPLGLEKKYFYDNLQAFFFTQQKPVWIVKMPDVIVFNIMRAGYDKENPQRRDQPKNCKPFEVLAEIALDRHFKKNKERAEKIFSKPDPRIEFQKDKENWSKHRYMLTAAVVHKGELANVGHNTAFVWDKGMDYILYDDERITTVDAWTMRSTCSGYVEKTTNACLLVYMRKKVWEEEKRHKERDKDDATGDLLRSNSLKRAIDEWENREMDRATIEAREKNHMLATLKQYNVHVPNQDDYNQVKKIFHTWMAQVRTAALQKPRPAAEVKAEEQRVKAEELSAHNRAVEAMASRREQPIEASRRPKKEESEEEEEEEQDEDDDSESSYYNDLDSRKRKAETGSAQTRPPKLARMDMEEAPEEDDYGQGASSSIVSSAVQSSTSTMTSDIPSSTVTSVVADDSQRELSMTSLQQSLETTKEVLKTTSASYSSTAWSHPSGAPHEAITELARENAYLSFLDDRRKEDNELDKKMLYPDSLSDNWYSGKSAKYERDVSRMYVHRLGRSYYEKHLEQLTSAQRDLLRESLEAELPVDMHRALMINNWRAVRKAIIKIIEWFFNMNDNFSTHWSSNALFFSMRIDGDISVPGLVYTLLETMNVKPLMRKEFLMPLMASRPSAPLRSQFMFHRYDVFLLCVLEHTTLVSVWRNKFKHRKKIEKHVRNTEDWMNKLEFMYYTFIRGIMTVLTAMSNFLKAVNVDNLRQIVGLNEAMFGRIAAISYAIVVLRTLEASRHMQRNVRAEAKTAGITDPVERHALVARLSVIRAILRALMLLKTQLGWWMRTTIHNDDIALVLERMDNPLRRAARNVGIAVTDQIPPQKDLIGEPNDKPHWRFDAHDALEKMSKGKYDKAADKAFDDVGDFSSLIDFILSCEEHHKATPAERNMMEFPQ